jgi:hypothetical protein
MCIHRSNVLLFEGQYASRPIVAHEFTFQKNFVVANLGNRYLLYLKISRLKQI